MEAKINNPHLSKSGKSINFFDKGTWHSIKKEILEEKNIKINSLRGLMINITHHEKRGGWVMIKKFKTISKQKDIFLDDLVNKSKNHQSNNQLDFSTIKENQIVEIYQKSENPYSQEIFNDISPFEITNHLFLCSYDDKLAYKIEYIGDFKEVNKKINSFICVLQNYISRGINVDAIKEESENISSILINLFLELIKRDYQPKELICLLPPSFEIKLFPSIIELKELGAIFNKIVKKRVNLEYFLKNISESIDYRNENEIQIFDVITKKLIIKLKIKKDYGKNVLPPTFITSENIEYKNLNNYKREINHLLKTAFYNWKTKIKFLKSEQLKALNLLMNKKTSVLGVLKTGFGKSLIYQFSTLLQSRIFLNVFPILSLISDQYNTMVDEYNFRFVIENEKLKTISESKLYSNTLFNKRLFLITPERLENTKMQWYFHSLGAKIGFMIFDEAHCISEWGHDFRPSYLIARHLLESIRKSHHLQVIALTATAAPHIQKDVAKLLNIAPIDIINIADGSGLNRKEITYKIKKYDVEDFNTYNHSIQFAEIVDRSISNSIENYEQGIAFFIKAGIPEDVEDQKYLKKNAALYAFERLKSKKDIALFTGPNKLLNGKPRSFKEYSQAKYIIATKSFGMGINLKKCDYVLLTEPPYSLEDLYQQSGRVGRIGQDSVVEIVCHNRTLIDPLSRQSPYQFFLKIDPQRVEGQKSAAILLCKWIDEFKKPFVVNIFKLKKNFKKIKSDYLRWAIAHLITEFNFIDKYCIKYWYKYESMEIKEITIFPINEMSNNTKILEKINEILINLQLEKKDNINEAIDTFYNFYFKKLQTEKLIGINILRDKLKDVDNKQFNGTKLIEKALNDYYKTRLDEVDKFVINFYELFSRKANFQEIISFLENLDNSLNKFELMESISRYSINDNFVKIASLVFSHTNGSRILINSSENILLNEINDDYLEEIRKRIIYEFLFDHSKLLVDNQEIKQTLIKLPYWKKIFDLFILNEALGGIIWKK